MDPENTPVGFKKSRLEKKSLIKPFKSPLTGLVKKKLEKQAKTIDVLEEIRLYQLGLKQLEDRQRILELTEKWRNVSKNGLEVLRRLVSAENGASVTLAEMALMVKGIVK
jgi:hypothetical protein